MICCENVTLLFTNNLNDISWLPNSDNTALTEDYSLHVADFTQQNQLSEN